MACTSSEESGIGRMHASDAILMCIDDRKGRWLLDPLKLSANLSHSQPSSKGFTCIYQISIFDSPSNMGSIVSAIGRGLIAIISAIAAVIETIISAIVGVIVTIFYVIEDILCCRCFGGRSRSRRGGYGSRYGGRGFGRSRRGAATGGGGMY
ncbi:uncharacterized protein FOMMEDRAFT_158953 [Fomitiporia mediterranea MF3/22]|uniref:uncharacterized protein n=1 Tax=Fomitiporia mediterranea (strain MF3/22) TaxID=694068 RepID=UPI00044077DA|nr:uncharacterized protein FOMMEDRAFT_158953 [Fomitiporia mediterranea MF3/22]EJD00284.1 hypothetical protein FOMMEDRAFT_158953 [Fomitiporia mediterranea MF3/22]